MLGSCYNKALASIVDLKEEQIRYRECKPITPVGSASAVTLLKQPPKKGVLQKYPLLNLVKSQITGRALRDLVALAGGNSSALDIEVEAWGPSSATKLIQGILSYSDASMLSSRTNAGVIYNTHHVYM
jgi:hypothetical protein